MSSHSDQEFNVPQVAIHPSFHHSNFRRFTAESVDLRPASDARFHLMPNSVSRNQPIIFIIVRKGVRTWTDQRHLAAQDIEQLR